MMISVKTSPRISESAHRRDWEELASVDPLWAISSAPSKKGGRWELDDFLRSGPREIARVLFRANSIGLPIKRQRALDFGCGIGRLTRAMAPFFDETVGVDIAETMITRARGVSPGCTFWQLSDFAFPKSHFDFIYSSHVLQHQPSREIAEGYIATFLEMLAPGGLLVFHAPYYLRFRNRIQPRRRLYRFLRYLRVPSDRLLEMGLQPIRMLWIPEERVKCVVESVGARILHTDDDSPGRSVRAKLYYCSFASNAGTLKSL